MLEAISAFIDFLMDFFRDLDPEVKDAIVKKVVEALIDVFSGYFDDAHGAAAA